LFHFVSLIFCKALIYKRLIKNPVSLVSFVSPSRETKRHAAIVCTFSHPGIAIKQTDLHIFT